MKKTTNLELMNLLLKSKSVKVQSLVENNVCIDFKHVYKIISLWNGKVNSTKKCTMNYETCISFCVK